MFYVLFYFKDPTFLLFLESNYKSKQKLHSWAEKIAEQVLGCLQGRQELLCYLYPLGELDSTHRDNEHLTSLLPEWRVRTCISLKLLGGSVIQYILALTIGSHRTPKFHDANSSFIRKCTGDQKNCGSLKNKSKAQWPSWL